METSLDLLARGIVNPEASAKLRWDILLVVLVVVVAIEIPLVVGFQLEVEAPSPTFYLDSFTNAAFAVDVALTLRTAYLDPVTHYMVTTPWRIAGRYLRSTFCIDLLSSVPIDALVLLYIPTSSNVVAQAQSVKLLRLVRLLRIMRLLRLLKTSQLMHTVAQWFSLRPAATNVLVLLFQVFFTAHWLGCFFAFAVIEEDGRAWWLPSFAKSGGASGGGGGGSPLPDYPLASRYLAALYWAVTTATTTGYGDILPLSDAQRLYTVLGMMLSAIVFGYAVGSVSTVWEEMNAGTSRRARHMSDVSQYVRDRNLPAGLGRRIRHYFSRQVAHKSMFREGEIRAFGLHL